jgi:hypothetical protein
VTGYPDAQKVLDGFDFCDAGRSGTWPDTMVILSETFGED